VAKAAGRPFTTTDAAHRVGVTVNTLKVLARAGRIAYQTGSGGRMLFTEGALAKYEGQFGKLSDDEEMRGNDRYFTPRTLAAAAGLSPHKIRKAVLEGRLKAVRGPGTRAWYMIPFEEGDRFIADLKSPQVLPKRGAAAV
jgi:hypothetical protein